jgi:5-methylcytosine-specific restriction endonuclease McrA
MRYLATRDGTNCALCGTKVRMHYRSGPKGTPSGLGPSIDHIIPVSERPDLADEPANWQLTHWKCNRNKKINANGKEQLALFG